MIPVNVIIDNKTVIDDLVSCEIQQREGDFCNSASIELKSQQFWELCDPTTDFGELRLKIVIGNTTYEFLCEERESNVSPAGIGFKVWGRSKQALLATPYSQTITDTGDTSHPWQTGDTTAQAIISHVVSNYCSSVTVNWNVDDFPVYQDTFSVSNQSSLDIISSLATAIGAELKAHTDGSLSVETYSIEEGTSLVSYTDLDKIVELNENIEYPSGYNAVTVYGYDEAAKKDSYLNATDDNDEDTTCENAEHYVKVYYYHTDLEPLCYFPDGTYGERGSGSESITETVELVWGQGNTTYPNTEGETEVTGDASIQYTTVEVTYSVYYKNFYLRASSENNYSAFFYFSDQTTYTIYRFTVESCLLDPSEIVLAWEDSSTKVPGDTVYAKVYNVGLTITEAYNSAGTSVTVHTASQQEYIEDEDITITNGEAQLTYPLDSGLTITYCQQGITGDPIVNVNFRDLSVNEFKDNSEFYIVYAKVSYYTRYIKYQMTIPESYACNFFNAWFYVQQDGFALSVLTIAFGVAADESLVPYQLLVRDYCSDEIVPGMHVWLNGVDKGETDADGYVSLGNLLPGASYTLKMTKDEYQQSQLDNLNNDSFVVPE